MNNKLIISDFYNGFMLGFQISDDKLMRIHNFNEDSVLGNIYCGYVKDVVKNINAAFVEFDTDKKGYFSLNGNEINLHQGDNVLVQVAGDRIKGKEYTLTSNINLNSECLVLTVGNTGISISKKIIDKDLRKFLKEILREYENDEYGFIFRTNSAQYSEEHIRRQADLLIEQWKGIKKHFKYCTSKTALIRKDNLQEMCKNYLKKTKGDIITDNVQVFRKISDCDLRITLAQNERISLCNKYCLEKKLNQALSKKVWLKSGAYLVIEPTEALTSVDINTGKAECRTNRNKTIKNINTEAAKEVIRQIQIRNLSGIIIIDFINMNNQKDYDELEQLMRDAVKDDFCPCYIIGFTRLGLMEISRKKKEKPIYEVVNNKVLG